MKKKKLLAVGIVSICLFAAGCGSNAVSEEKDAEDTPTVQETETEEQETENEPQETADAETETAEAVDNVDEAENYDDYEELVSVPVDGRDGTKENPYQVGDTIYFPKVLVAWEQDSEEDVYSSLTIVIEETTPEYVKISYNFGVDSWEKLNIDNWYSNYVDVHNMLTPFRFDSEFNQVGTPLEASSTLGEEEYVIFYKDDPTEFTLYYQDFDQMGCIEGTDYLMLIFNQYSDALMEEGEAGFNCTVIKVS
jgi:hypothetical protein